MFLRVFEFIIYLIIYNWYKFWYILRNWYRVYELRFFYFYSKVIGVWKYIIVCRCKEKYLILEEKLSVFWELYNIFFTRYGKLIDCE